MGVDHTAGRRAPIPEEPPPPDEDDDVEDDDEDDDVEDDDDDEPVFPPVQASSVIPTTPPQSSTRMGAVLSSKAGWSCGPHGAAGDSSSQWDAHPGEGVIRFKRLAAGIWWAAITVTRIRQHGAGR